MVYTEITVKLLKYGLSYTKVDFDEANSSELLMKFPLSTYTASTTGTCILLLYYMQLHLHTNSYTGTIISGLTQELSDDMSRNV